MEFPAIDLTKQPWNFETDLPICFDKYVSRAAKRNFNKYLKEKTFCDCQGGVYRIVGIQRRVSLLRNIFYFLPGVRNYELIFAKTSRSMGVEEVRTFVLNRLRESDDERDEGKFESYVKSATTIRELLGEKSHRVFQVAKGQVSELK